MPEQDPIERLNTALEGLSIQDQAAPDREIRELLALARRLRVIPRETFRAKLRVQLEERAMTLDTATTLPLREGFHSLTPYIIMRGAAEFIEFAKEVFGAEEKLRVPAREPRPHYARGTQAG